MNFLTHEEIKKQEDFKEEIIPHLDALYNFALRLTSNPSDAGDIVQETILKAYRFFNSYEKGTNAKAWLFRILNNTYINEYRKKSRLPDMVDYGEISSFFEVIRDERTDTSDMEDRIFRRLIGDDITNALEELQDKYRIVVLLCDLEDFTYEEISNMLDIPIGTVRSRLHRGRNHLKKRLFKFAKKRGYEESVTST
jgi:RNA polymerase sigma-70 factor (ECF subfamily)